MPPGAALLAVGGYGRGELFPHSDVDVLVLLPADQAHANDALKASIEGFITACWDIGLEIGSSGAHGRRMRRDGAQRRDGADGAARIALPVRLARASTAISRKPPTAAMDPKAFLRAKTLEMRQRHTKYEDTPYSLEPNCKESPGGLRDLQVVIWVARAAGLGKSWNELAHSGPDHAVRGEAVAAQRRRAEADPRAAAHRRRPARGPAGVRPADRRGRRASATRRPKSQRASEVLMRRYYWAAKAVTQLNQILMLNIEEQHQRLAGRADAPDQRALPRPRRHARGGERRPVRSAIRTRSSRPFSSTSRRPASRACRRARCARCTTRAT